MAPSSIRTVKLFVRATLALGLLSATASAGFHLMQIQEVIGAVNGDPTAQAIQLRMSAGGQTFVQGINVWASNSSGTGRTLVLSIPSNVSGTTGSTILLASQNFKTTMINGGDTGFAPDFLFTNLIPASYLAA